MNQSGNHHVRKNTAFMFSSAWREYKSVIFFCLILPLISVAKSGTELFLTPVILKQAELSAPLTDLLFFIALFGLSLLFFTALDAYLRQNILFGRVAVRMSILEQVNNKMAKTSYPNTLDTEFIRAQNRASKACYVNTEATEAFWTSFTHVLSGFLGLFLYMMLLLRLHPLILFVTFFTSLAGYQINQRISQWTWLHREEEAACKKQMNYIHQIATGRAYAKDIRVFGLKPWLDEVWNSGFHLYRTFLFRRERAYLLTSFMDLIFTLLRNGTAYVFLVYMTLNGGLSASDFLLYFTAVGGFHQWITKILDNGILLYRQSLDLSALREFLDWPEPFLFEQGKPLVPDLNQPYEIRLKQVSFSYRPDAKPVISNVNLTISPGESLAVVGLNGAGKTTLIKLICGFLDPTQGAVLLNGTDIRQYNRRDYYALFSAVFQDFSLLEASVAENVAQQVDHINIEKVQTCIDLAGLTQTIKHLPGGLDTKIGRQVFDDGIELSGGQTQRLMLARALYKNAPILILDEPTSALDPIAEQDIYEKYSQMTKGKTAVFISHRLASTRFCDRILFLEQGEITEEGTHEQLLAADGGYAGLFRIQSQYYQEGGVYHES